MLPFLELLDTEEEKEKLLIIYECFKNALYEIAYYKMKHVEQAEDMVHDTFMALTKHMDKIDEQAYVFLKGYLDAKKYSENLTITEYAALTDSKAHVRAWNYIVTILNHKIYDYWNKKETQSVIYVEEYDDMASFSTTEPMSLVEEKEIKILLKEALLSMPDSYKEVIYLKYFQKMSVKEIAMLLEKSNDNVKKMLERGRKMIKLKLEEGGYYDV